MPAQEVSLDEVRGLESHVLFLLFQMHRMSVSLGQGYVVLCKKPLACHVGVYILIKCFLGLWQKLSILLAFPFVPSFEICFWVKSRCSKVVINCISQIFKNCLSKQWKVDCVFSSIILLYSQIPILVHNFPEDILTYELVYVYLITNLITIHRFLSYLVSFLSFLKQCLRHSVKSVSTHPLLCHEVPSLWRKFTYPVFLVNFSLPPLVF